jgi:hypothetical protein
LFRSQAISPSVTAIVRYLEQNKKIVRISPRKRGSRGNLIIWRHREFEIGSVSVEFRRLTLGAGLRPHPRSELTLGTGLRTLPSARPEVSRPPATSGADLDVGRGCWVGRGSLSPTGGLLHRPPKKLEKPATASDQSAPTAQPDRSDQKRRPASLLRLSLVPFGGGH